MFVGGGDRLLAACQALPFQLVEIIAQGRVFRHGLRDHGVAKVGDPGNAGLFVQGSGDYQTGGNGVGGPYHVRPALFDHCQPLGHRPVFPVGPAVRDGGKTQIATEYGEVPRRVQGESPLNVQLFRDVGNLFHALCGQGAGMDGEDLRLPAVIWEVTAEAQRSLHSASPCRRKVEGDHENVFCSLRRHPTAPKKCGLLKPTPG